MIECNTHLLKHMKQAILVWSFRQNIFPGCYPEKTSKIGRAVDIVSCGRCGDCNFVDKDRRKTLR